jgi:hypothetical protein
VGVVIMADEPSGKDIKVPGLGNLPKKYAVGGVVVAVVIAVILAVRSRRAAASSTAAANAGTTAQVTDPAGNVCSALDPGSGYCPGTAEDSEYYSQSSALEDENGEDFSGAGGSVNSGYDAAGYPIGSAADLAWQASQESGSSTGTTGGTGTTATGTTGAAATNSDWLTEAVAALPGDTSTIQTALASVLGGVTVTTAQKNLFEEAVGILGPPPQGYPTPIKTSDTASQPGSTSGKIAVPNVKGFTTGAAHNAIDGAGLHAIAASGQKDNWTVTGTTPKAGTMVNSGSNVTILASAPAATAAKK